MSLSLDRPLPDNGLMVPSSDDIRGSNWRVGAVSDATLQGDVVEPVAPGPSLDVSYPDELACDIALPTGRTLRLRPIRCHDIAGLEAFHHHLSQESVYSRYFSFRPDLSGEELRRLTHVDYVDRLALVVEDEGELVAVARYDRYPGTQDAEVAFVVRDDYQHLGLGSRLLVNLARAARARGVTQFRAETMATNRGMMAVFLHSGFRVSTTVSSGEVSVRFSLDSLDEVPDSTHGSPV